MSEPQDVRLTLPDGTIVRPAEVRRLRALDSDSATMERWEAVFRPDDVRGVTRHGVWLRAEAVSRPVILTSIVEASIVGTIFP